MNKTKNDRLKELKDTQDAIQTYLKEKMLNQLKKLEKPEDLLKI